MSFSLLLHFLSVASISLLFPFVTLCSLFSRLAQYLFNFSSFRLFLSPFCYTSSATSTSLLFPFVILQLTVITSCSTNFSVVSSPFQYSFSCTFHVTRTSLYYFLLLLQVDSVLTCCSTNSFFVFRLPILSGPPFRVSITRSKAPGNKSSSLRAEKHEQEMPCQ